MVYGFNAVLLNVLYNTTVLRGQHAVLMLYSLTAHPSGEFEFNVVGVQPFWTREDKITLSSLLIINNYTLLCRT
jgi:hypothetical protein